MEHVILPLIAIAVFLTSGMMLAQTAVQSADQFSTRWKEMGVRTEELACTAISATAIQARVPWNGVVEVTVENSGQRSLGKFADWDVVVQWYDASSVYYIKRLSYVTGTSPGDDQWAVYALQLNGSTETFQPGMLDPSEQLILHMKPVPDLGNGKALMVVVSTPNGATTSIQFRR